MNALRRLRSSWRIAAILALAAGIGVPLVVGCSTGGGGGGGGMVLLSFNLENIRSVFLNERLVFKFSQPVDRNSVNSNTIRIRYDASRIDRDGDGQADNPSDTNAAPQGTFTVSGDTVFFDPKLPVRCDNSDPGLVPTHTPVGSTMTLNLVYSVTIPALSTSNPGVVRSTGGRPMSRAYQATFQTVFDASFPPDIASGSFFDVFPGRPFVASIEATPSAGGASPTTSIGVVFSEPILPSSLCGEESLFLEAVGPNLGKTERVSASVFVDQLPARTRVTLRPTIPIPGNTEVRIRVSDAIRDFGGNRLNLSAPATPPLVVRVMPTTPQSGFFEELFDGPANEDVDATGAEWGGGILTPGAGGDASDGPFVPTANTTIDTTTKSLYQFSRLDIPEGVTVRITGPNACRILVASTARIVGRLSLEGGIGGDVVTSPETGGPGGAGGPGGFAGGNGDSDPGGGGLNGQGPGGGQGSVSSAANAGTNETTGGGGGGSYGLPGEPGDNTLRILPPGQPGPVYGDPTLNPNLGFLVGGSGGGGAGWCDLNDEPGSGGGGGGGALQLQVGRGVSLLRGLNTAGSISASGGKSGDNLSALGASGGGGSGGAILLQAAAGNVLVGNDSEILAIGGPFGDTGHDTPLPPNKGHGGIGGVGRIRVEVDQSRGFSLVTADPDAIQPSPNPFMGAQFDFAGAVSVGTSRFFDTRSLFPNYSFVPGGTVPGVGLPYNEDNADRFPPGTIVYLFQGAQEDPDNPGLPDLDALRPPTFTFNIDEVDDSRFIRFQVLFVMPTPAPLDLPTVSTVRFAFSTN